MRKERIVVINNDCKNEWMFDTYYHLYHKDNRLRKQVKISDNEIMSYILYYNYRNQIILSWNIGTIDGGFIVSKGLGKSKIINYESAKRKEVKKLIELTEMLDNTYLENLNKNTKVTNNGIFVPSEEF